MPITDPLVLPVDVAVTPVEALAPGLRARLRAQDGEFALTRPRGRALAKVISRESALLLQEFRTAQRVADVVIAAAGRRHGDPALLLEQAWPLLRDCFDARFLVAADSPEAAAILPTRERGDRVGPFEVLRCLKLKDDTELYQARDRAGSLAALKLGRPGRRADVLGMLGREAAVLQHLGGVGAPALLARGNHRGRPWLAARWCEGVSPDAPARELRERGTPEAREALRRLALVIARAYARLHRRQVLHGDVWPGNVLIGRRGEVRLVDFGLARPLSPLRLAGKPGSGGVAAFFPPEYAEALLADRPLPPPDAQSEQFSIGVLLFQLFCGRHYTDFALDREKMLEQILVEPPRPFSARQAVPWPEVEQLLARALAKDPARRFRSLAALEQALARVSLPRPARPTRSSPPQAQPTRLVEDFLARVAIGGADFPQADEVTGRAPTCSLKLGGAGVAYALYRLACLRDSAPLLAAADAWLARSEAASGRAEAFLDAAAELTPQTVGPVSPYHAEPGLYLVRGLIANAQTDPAGVRMAAKRFAAASRTPWSTVDLTLGRAGTLLASALLLEAAEGGSGIGVNPVRRVGEDTLEALWWELDSYGPLAASARLMDLGMAHGWAGVLYASLRWCDAARSPLPAPLRGRLDELVDCAEPAGRGVVWQRRRPSDATAVGSEGEITGWCAGPSGFIHLWTLAHARYREPRFIQLAEASAWSTWDGTSGVPDLCCGLAGRAYGLLNLYRYSGATEWLERARVLAHRAARLIDRWEGTRARPLSLFKAVPGVVLILADLERPETSCMPLFEPEGWPEPADRRDG